MLALAVNRIINIYFEKLRSSRIKIIQLAVETLGGLSLTLSRDVKTRGMFDWWMESCFKNQNSIYCNHSIYRLDVNVFDKGYRSHATCKAHASTKLATFQDFKEHRESFSQHFQNLLIIFLIAQIILKEKIALKLT